MCRVEYNTPEYDVLMHQSTVHRYVTWKAIQKDVL
jgi:hypothetical protein